MRGYPDPNSTSAAAPLLEQLRDPGYFSPDQRLAHALRLLEAFVELAKARSTAQVGSDPQQTEVAGAAAEVGDQHERVGVEGLLVVVGGGDRFVLETEIREPRLAE